MARKFGKYAISNLMMYIVAFMAMVYALVMLMPVNLSLFLGFALLYPDFRVNPFFFLPVRVKYLAMIDAAGLLVSFVMRTASTRIALMMALLNVLLFFVGNLIQRIKSAYRHYKWKKSFRE
ncbi:MAG: hypothetical protein Q4G06_11570 [Clostridia bacterium]|nr:hypothetical protein [Clostridia bacterium]